METQHPRVSGRHRGGLGSSGTERRPARHPALGCSRLTRDPGITQTPAAHSYTMVAPSLTGVQRGLDLTLCRELPGPALPEVGTGRALPSLLARQGQAGPGQGASPVPPSRLPALGLGTGRASRGQTSTAHPRSGTGTEGEPAALCLCRAKARSRWLQITAPFICGRGNWAELGPNGHSARAGGIAERRRQKRSCAQPCPAAWGKEWLPSVGSLP